MPTPLLQHKSPFEKLFHTTPDYTFLKIFGCACYPNLCPYNSHKFSPQSKECVFLGYSQHHKRYTCLNLESDRMYISRDVIFDENRFPFATVSPIPESPQSTHPTVLPPLLFPPPPSSTIIPPDPPSRLTSPPVHSWSSPGPSPNSPVVSSMPCSSSYADPPRTRIHPMRTRSLNNIVKQRQLTDGRIRYPISQALVAASTSEPLEPTCYSNAIHIPEWRTAMQIEFNALLQNQTLSLVPSHSSQNIVGCKWVFKLKRKADGSIERHKALLIAKGFHQQAEVDYGETYSPV
jgi:hypothetical protein